MDVSFGENGDEVIEITGDSAAEESAVWVEGGRGEDEFGKCQWG